MNGTAVVASSGEKPLAEQVVSSQAHLAGCLPKGFPVTQATVSPRPSKRGRSQGKAADGTMRYVSQPAIRPDQDALA